MKTSVIRLRKTSSHCRITEVVTANKPPNLNQLTGDRIKLLTLFPIFKFDKEGKIKLVDSLLIPVYCEIQVRVLKRSSRRFQYSYRIQLQGEDYIKNSFSNFSWYNFLLKNVGKYKVYV
jgi:hypothetical protein